MTTKDDRDRYLRALHAIQTGVAYQMEDPTVKETAPKHLRVGVSSALINSSALADLLMTKGLITEAEYFASLADYAEREVAEYTERVRRQFGSDNITLG